MAHKFFFLSFCCFPLLMLPASASAKILDRDSIVQRELDCFAQNSQDKGDLDWQDVCAMNVAPARNEALQVVAAGPLDDYLQEPLEEHTQEPAAPVKKSKKAPAPVLEESFHAEDHEESAPDLWRRVNYKYAHFYQNPDKFLDLETSLDVGMRWDKLQWNIADLDNNPNILSELTWDDVHSFSVATRGDLAVDKKYVFDWSGGYAWIYEGDNQDSDYAGNGRTLEFSRSNNSADIGHMLDLSAGGGVRVTLAGEDSHAVKDYLMVDELSLDFLAGYAYNEQKYYMTNGNQTIPASGGFPGLKSHYYATWRSPWLGLQVKGQRNRVRGFFRTEFHWADYYGKANWNLRSDFKHPKSYEHEGDGYGVVLGGGGSYLMTPNWSIDLTTKFQYWYVEDGIDRTFFSNGTTLETGLNEVKWTSATIALGNTIHF